MKILSFPLFLASILFSLAACTVDKPILPKKITSTGTNVKDTTGTGKTGTDTTGTAKTDTTKSGYYFKGTLGSQAFDWEVTNNVSGWIMATLDVSGTLTAYIGSSGTFQPQYGVEIISSSIDTAASAQAKSTYFNSFISTGAWAYVTAFPYNVNAKAVIINYIDSNGNGYSSVGPQTGSTATVISVTKIAADAHYNESLKIKLSLNCILYSADGSNAAPIKLSNAETTVRLENLL